MEFFVVTNGNYILGYFRERKNAEKANAENNLLIEQFRGTPNVDLTPCWCETIETED